MKPVRRSSFAHSGGYTAPSDNGARPPVAPLDEFLGEPARSSPRSRQATAPFTFQVGFPIERLQLYREVFHQIGSLKSTLSRLLAVFPRGDEPIATTASLLLERQVLTELKDELSLPLQLLERHPFYQRVGGVHSVKPLLEQINGLLGPPPPQPTSSDVAKNSPRGAPSFAHSQSHGPSDLHGTVSSLKDSFKSFKAVEPHSQPVSPVAQSQSTPTPESGALKGDVKKYLGVVSKLSQENQISEDQKGLLKRAILRHNKAVFALFGSFEKDENVAAFVGQVDAVLKSPQPDPAPGDGPKNSAPLS